MRNSIVIAFLSVVSAQLIFAQCPEYDLKPPHLSGVVVDNSVSLDHQSRIFTYTYTVTNGRRSTGCINGLEIDILAGSGEAALSDSGLTDYPRYVNRSPLELDSSIHIVPVGIPGLPSMGGLTSVWFAGFSQDGTVSWFRAIPDYRLAPGSSISGIVMTSHALPGLRKYIVTPSYNPKPAVEITPENEDSVYMNTPEPTAEQDSAELALEDSIKVRGWTVGPTAPPADLSALSWIDTLASYKHQCVTLSWLTNAPAHEKDESDDRADEGIVERLDRRLDRAKEALAKSDSVKAKLELTLFVKEVEQLYGKEAKGERSKEKGKEVLTSEGYALLKYNAEYLIDRLPERHGRGEERRGKK